MSKAAPAPYSTLDIGSRVSFHTYIVDANGRKIGAVWGPTAEKVWTAALFAAAPDLLAQLKIARECIAYCRRAHKDIQSGDGVPVEIFIDAAIAKAEGAP